MPPPLKVVEPLAEPLLIVRPLRVTDFVDFATSNTREALLPLTVSWPAPGPAMVTLWLMSTSPLVSVMVWPFSLEAKTMVSLLWAAAISARSEPAPLSRLFRTVSVLGTQRSSSASSVGRKVGRAAGVFLLDTDRGDRPRGFDSQRVNDIARVSYSRSVCETKEKPTMSARRPSAGAWLSRQ